MTDPSPGSSNLFIRVEGRTYDVDDPEFRDITTLTAAVQTAAADGTVLVIRLRASSVHQNLVLAAGRVGDVVVGGNQGPGARPGVNDGHG